MTYEPKEDEPRQAGPHVAHDIRMLARAYENRGNAFAYTAWFIHCRSVMGFLYCKGDRTKDDVYASHYVRDWPNVLSGLQLPDDHKKYWTATNKLAAHLTYERIKYASRPSDKQIVPSREMTDHLLGLTEVFFGRLSEEQKTWFGGLRR